MQSYSETQAATHDSLNQFINENLKKLTTIFQEFGYLTPFQWYLVENILDKGGILLTFFENCMTATRPVYRDIGMISAPFEWELIQDAIFFNGLYRTKDNLIIDYALMEYFNRKRTDIDTNWYSLHHIWTCLKFNREFRRSELQPFKSLYLYIHEHLLPLLLKLKSIPLIKETRKLLVEVYKTSSNSALLTISQLIKKIVPSWEIGPPFNRYEFEIFRRYNKWLGLGKLVN